MKNVKTDVYDFIVKNWDKCKRFEPEDKDTLIGLPYPYIVPTCSMAFQEMYYWDTYFTCEGLILSGRADLAKNCADNMAFMINKYGFVPNGSRTYFLTRSQPPYFCMLVKAVFDVLKDIKWLENIYPVIEKEYDFWQRERSCPMGLNHYGSSEFDEESGKKIYERITDRLSFKKPISEYKSYADFAENAIAECESGWDFNPRFNLKCKYFAPVDLNSNLYLYEKLMEKFSLILKNGHEERWRKRAEKRKELMNKYLWNGKFFADYNYAENSLTNVFSAAAFHPLWAGLADDTQAERTYSQLNCIELAYGISACEKSENNGIFQWAYPNAWAPLHYITVFGLDNYGYNDAALRISNKYVSAINSIFEKTHNLWEKYNASDGSINVTNEYDMPDMLGWTAGVYLSCREYILTNQKGCINNEYTIS